jgi:diaminopimelate epimerase
MASGDVIFYMEHEPQMNECHMSLLGGRQVTKMNGLGNEIVILDLRGTSLEVSPGEARAIGRGEGLAFDQLMVLLDPHAADTDAFMKIYNIDGSQSAACGNGTRCVAWWLSRDDRRTELALETAAGRLACTRTGDWRFAADMGRPRLTWNEIPLRDACADTRVIDLTLKIDDAPALQGPSAVNMGNPHAIFWVEDLEAYDLASIGPVLETDPLFPERANISLVRILGRDHIALKVWERGAGLTRACGSAACAALVAAVRKNLTDRAARVSLPGGDLFITWRDDEHVVMEGPVELEFETELDPTLFEGVAA